MSRTDNKSNNSTSPGQIKKGRRSFFSKIGFGAIAAVIAGSAPFRLFAKKQDSAENEPGKRFIIKENPDSVKRMKQVGNG